MEVWMIDFNQYAAKRFLAGYLSLALDELAEGQTIHYTDMKRLLGGKYEAYDKEDRADLSFPVSEKAKEWDRKRGDLLRRIGFAINRKQLTTNGKRSDKENEQRRQFNIEAERLLESYSEFIEGHPADEQGFIIYEGSFEAPWNEPHLAALEVIEEFPLPRLKKPGEFHEDSHRQELQRRYLQDLLDELEGRPEDAPQGKTRSFLLEKIKGGYNQW
jgi:hypothetical protein